MFAQSLARCWPPARRIVSLTVKVTLPYYVIQWIGDYKLNAFTTSIQLSLAVIEPGTSMAYQWETFVFPLSTKTSAKALQCFRWNLNYANYFHYRLLASHSLYNHSYVCYCLFAQLLIAPPRWYLLLFMATLFAPLHISVLCMNSH